MCSSRVASSQGPHGARPAFGHNRCLPVAIHGCPRNIPTAGDPRQAIDAIDGGRDRLAHGLDLRRAERGAGLEAGNLLPQQLGLHGHLADLSLQPRDLVVAVVARARAPSAPPRRPAKPAPAIPSNRAAVTLSSRASSSSGSPRSSRLTARSFRFAEKRCAGGPPAELLRQLLGGAPTSPPAPSCPPPSFRPFGSPSFPCGPFNRSRMSQPTLMHPSPANTRPGRNIPVYRLAPSQRTWFNRGGRSARQCVRPSDTTTPPALRPCIGAL